MAVKTITIDTEAYELLAAQKRGNESFSKVIKRRLRPERTAASLLEHVDEACLSVEALDRAEEIVRSREDSPADSAVLGQDS